MKTLILVRHAKSDWDDEHLKDFDRPLNNRGRRDAPYMGKVLVAKKIKPDLIISSPAQRALSTAEFFAAEFQYPLENIQKEQVIYERGMKEILSMVGNVSNDIKTIIMFGHNPVISQISSFFYNQHIDMPTCSVACLDFNIKDWQDIATSPGKLRFFDYPKKYFK